MGRLVQYKGKKIETLEEVRKLDVGSEVWITYQMKDSKRIHMDHPIKIARKVDGKLFYGRVGSIEYIDLESPFEDADGVHEFFHVEEKLDLEVGSAKDLALFLQNAVGFYHEEGLAGVRDVFIEETDHDEIKVTVDETEEVEIVWKLKTISRTVLVHDEVVGSVGDPGIGETVNKILKDQTNG